MSGQPSAVMDWAHFERCRIEMGASFIKIIGYFREDAIESLQRIEQAMREKDMVGLVAPAHKLKGEARQVGALALADRAEYVEATARHCVEVKHVADELIPDIVELRRLWNATIGMIDAKLSPLAQRSAPAGFGRRAAGAAGPHNQGFGRL